MKIKWPLVVIVTSLLLFYLLPPIDTDLGWHLRYGKEIFEHHRVFKTNEIGFYMSDYQWTHSYSLYQLITYTVFKLFGFWGLSILSSMCITVIFYSFIKTYFKKGILIYPLVFFLALISHTVFYLGWRSQLFSLLGVSILYHLILTDKRFSTPKVISLFFIFALWANIHGGFPLGLILIGFYFLEKLINDKNNLLNIGVALLISFGATFLNPFGTKIYQEIYRHSWYPLNQLIAEWVAPNPFQFLLIIFIFAFLLIAFLTKEKPTQWVKQEKHIFLVLSWLFFSFLAIKARRHLPFFGLASIYLIADLISLSHLKNKSYFKKTIPIFLLLAAAIWKLTHWPSLNNPWQSICQHSKWTQPCEAVNYLKKNENACQNIFNTYEWGGFLSWYLPNNKTFVDGRMPAWPTREGKSPYTIYLEILQTQPGWEEKLEKYQADCLLITRNTFMDLELRKDKDYSWKLIYEDKNAAIYQKQN